MIFSPSAQDWAQLGLLLYHWATSKTHECMQVRVHVCEYLFRPEGNDRHLPHWFTTLVLRHCHKLSHHFVKISWGVNPNDLCGPVPFPPLALGFQDHVTTHSAERSNSSPNACEPPGQPPSTQISKFFFFLKLSLLIGKYLPMMNFPPINVKTFLHLALTLFHHFVIAYIATSEFLSILQLATVFLVYSACSFIVFDNLFERWFFCFQLKCLSAPFILEITCLEIKTGFVKSEAKRS